MPSESRKGSVARWFALFTVAMMLASSAATAQEDTESKFQIHGFLTQAYATANYSKGGPTSDEIYLGIPEDGTTDYRFLALQFRYEISPKDVMVIQLSSRRLGESPVSEIEDDIELDWAFYERRLRDHTSLKVGRIQIPMGIFNEIRDVGTILPFYRPPSTFYFEGSFTSETVDGLALSHTFMPETEWSLEGNAFFGQWDLIEADVFDPTQPPKIAKAKDAWGVQFWLNTPIGMRLGWGYQERDVSEGQEGVFRPIGEESGFGDHYISLDGVFGRFVVRAEWRKLGGTLDSPLGFTARAFNTIRYVQLGYEANEKFRIFLQGELADVAQAAPQFTEDADFDIREDYGIALNYAFSPNVVLKAEYHQVDQQLAVFAPVFIPQPPFFLLQPIVQNFNDGDYSILSLAVSF